MSPRPGSSEELRLVLASLHGVFDGEEAVDEYAHALQCAGLALSAGGDAELVVAALLHDVARSPLVGPADGGLPHEAAGAVWLLPRYGEHVAWLVGAHVAAKLFLIATEPDYLARLSPESVRSAEVQGAQATADLSRHPLWPQAIELRRFDDGAKVPGAETPDLEALVALAASVSVR